MCRVMSIPMPRFGRHRGWDSELITLPVLAVPQRLRNERRLLALLAVGVVALGDCRVGAASGRPVCSATGRYGPIVDAVAAFGEIGVASAGG